MQCLTTVGRLALVPLAAALAVLAFQATYGSASWRLFQNARYKTRALTQGTTSADQLPPDAQFMIGNSLTRNLLTYFEGSAAYRLRWGNLLAAVPSGPPFTRRIMLRHWAWWYVGAVGITIVGAASVVCALRIRQRWRCLAEVAVRRGEPIVSWPVAVANAALLALALWWPTALLVWYFSVDRSWSIETYMFDRAVGPWESAAAFAALALITAALAFRREVRQQRLLIDRTGACAVCGYDAGHPKALKCPECGSDRHAAARASAARAWFWRIGPRLGVAFAALLLIGAIAVPQFAPMLLPDLKAWVLMRPYPVEGGSDGIIRARQDETLFLRWDRGVGVVHWNVTSEEADSAGTHQLYRFISAYWSRENYLFNIEDAVVRRGVFRVPVNECLALEIPVGPRSIILDARPDCAPDGLRFFYHRGVIDLVRVVPGTWVVADDLGARLAAPDAGPTDVMDPLLWTVKVRPR